MALPELFKVKQKRYLDDNGKRCKKSEPGAIETITKSDCWYADIKPTESAADRIARHKARLPAPKRKRVKLCSDKRAAQKMLAELVDQSDKVAAGLKDYRAVATQDLCDLIDDFERFLKTTPKKRGGKRTQEYIDLTIVRIQKVFGGCGFLRLADVDCEAIAEWLDIQREVDVKPTKARVRGTAKTYQEIADRFNVSVTTVTYWRRKGAPIIPRSKNSLADIAAWHAEYTKPKNIGSTTSDHYTCLLYTSPSPRDRTRSRMPSSA